MNTRPDPPARARVLDPIDRTSEVLFGLFMVLTFTGTLSVATAGREDVRTMLIAAIGCNIAWGFVDAVMYVLRSVVARGHQATFERAVREAPSAEQAHRLIAVALPALHGTADTALLESVRRWICSRPASAVAPARLRATDFRAALGVFLLVVSATFPPVLPFVFFDDLQRAMRVSGGIAVAMLFVAGYRWGRYAGFHPMGVGLVMVVLGVITELIVIALGG